MYYNIIVRFVAIKKIISPKYSTIDSNTGIGNMAEKRVFRNYLVTNGEQNKKKSYKKIQFFPHQNNINTKKLDATHTTKSMSRRWYIIY